MYRREGVEGKNREKVKGGACFCSGVRGNALGTVHMYLLC